MTDKSPVQVTTHLGAKNITLSADTASEMAELTEKLMEHADQIIENLTTLDQIILSKSVMATGSVNPTPETAATPFQPSDPPPSGGGSSNCQHGPRVLKSGEKNGKSWKGQFCPANDRDCKPVWG